MEHFRITGLITLVFSSLVSLERKYIMETPDCSTCIWSWDTAAYVQFPGLIETWYHPSGRNTQNRYAICNPNNPQEPNNWLRSHVIEVGDIQRLDVTFRYFSHPCGQSASFCKESFYAYVWESNTSVTSLQIPHPINDFQLYRRFANITLKSDQETILTVPLHVTNKYIVLGIQDQGGCRTLFSVKVSYKFCSEKTLEDSLVSLPSMVSLVELTAVQGICMANAKQIVPGNLTVFCDGDGEWNTSRLESRCVCKEDMENTRGVCTVPGAPEDITVAYLAETNSIILSWIVKCKNGIIQEYRIEYFSVDDSSGSKTLSTSVNKIQIGSLPAGKTFRFEVYAVNNIGIGSPGDTTFHIPKDDPSDDFTIYIVICVILSTILLIGTALVGVYVYRQRKARHRSGREGDSVSRVEIDNLENSRAIATPQTSGGDLTSWNHGQYMEMSDITDNELERNDIKFIRLLGSGNFGEVHKAVISECIVAVKSLKENASQKDKQDMLTELNVMKSLKSHNHVVQMIGHSTRGDPLLLILEYMPYGDLLGYLRISRGHHDIYNSGEKKPTSRLTDTELLSFAWMIADGMSYLADMRVVHRDLAARNVLVGENKVCKISDFGLARDVNTEVYVRTSQACLPVKWMPPESLFLGESSTKSDVWSYGIVLWEVFTIGDSPYPGVKPREVATLLERGYRMPRPNHISEELYSVMSECWLEKPEDRPAFRWICTAMRRLLNDHKTYVNLDVYNDQDYVNFDMVDELQ